VLLLCDIWPLKRTRDQGRNIYVRLILEKTPFFILSIASAAVTVAAQRSMSAVASLSNFPFGGRLQNAVVSYAKYIGTVFFPARLAVWYPYDRDLGPVEVGAAFLLLAAITAACVWQFGKRKYLLFGWLWFLGTLVPVIGIVQVGGQSMADRYTYLPFFGLFVMLVFGAAELVAAFNLDKRIVAAAAAVLIAALAVPAYIQTSHWQTNETLYTHTLSVTEKNFLISQNYCHALMEEDRLDEAEHVCRTALGYQPDYYELLNTLGIIRFKQQDFAGAENLFKAAIDSERIHPLTFSNLALTQILQGRPEEGEANLERAVALSGDSVPPQAFGNALMTLIEEYLKQGKDAKAVENIRRLLFVQPDSIEARMKLVEMLLKEKRWDEAGRETEIVLRIDQNNAVAWNSLGVIFLAKEQTKDAVEAFKRALSLNPDYDEAKTNLDLATKAAR
jgi:tetratricopeptide (TPR) repeat protein